MRVRPRSVIALALALCAALLGAGNTASATGPEQDRMRQEQAYWTARRMAEAVPVTALLRDPAARPAPGTALTPVAAPPRPARRFGGLPMVGTFFFDGSHLGGRTTYCSGSVVHSAGRNLVLTAGHCAIGLSGARHAVFVPEYHDGAAAGGQPYGVFPVTALYVDPRYRANTKGAASDLDLAFVRVAPNGGSAVESRTGALTFGRTPRYDNDVTVVGYPATGSPTARRRPVRCDVRTSRLKGFHQMRMFCGGFYGGVSGGPWISGYDPATRTGRIIGNIGGYNGGGNDANSDGVSFSPFYGKDAQDLYRDADADRAVRRPAAYRPATVARRCAPDVTGSPVTVLPVVWPARARPEGRTRTGL
ncbi:trypsin-like serine peptidase [Streptomyces luteireticuli]|uniref:Trypsin-like serine protease n=1 Tax=Streptomyces luteireticuli TaxID=173858 RepID=A0ABN0YXT9_9ACTN